MSNMSHLKPLKFISVLTLVLHSSCGILAECMNDKPQWFMQLGLRDISNSLRSNQRIPISQTEPESSQKFKDYNSIYGITSKYDFNEDVKHSPLPLELVGNQYYYFGTYFKTNFFQAMRFCEVHGMNLLSIESSTENDLIMNYLKANYPKEEHIWTSGTDLGSEGEFMWYSTGRRFNYTFWIPPQPDNGGKVENCLILNWLKGGKYKWNDVVCTSNYNFICELKSCSNFCTNIS